MNPEPMDNELHFETCFQALTGNSPFPWQKALYDRFTSDRADKIPLLCDIPTGLGKTSVIAVWLIALANGATLPRRLAYCLPMRVLVEQTRDNVVRWLHNLKRFGGKATVDSPLGPGKRAATNNQN